MDKNNFRYFTLLLINDNNHSKIVKYLFLKKISTTLEVIINQYM